jgi:hypothetical protein
MEGKLTVYFDDPFRVGIFEREEENGYCVSRLIFGTEPTDVQLYEYVQRGYVHLDFSQPVKDQIRSIQKKNFKRMQREVRKEVDEAGIGTKAQQAVKLQIEANKRSTR